jgi:gamma-glutamyltranspeptidase/glutathione hydrolase
MKGAVAAGHPLTVEAGARALAGGGNAVDACVAAGLVSWVTESPLTGPGGGGFMLVHRARDRSDRLLDFFVAVPGRGLRDGRRGTLQAVDVVFEPTNIQVFHVGGPSCAVPGMIAGLAAAHRAYGSRPWPELVAPALELAGGGVEVTEAQASLHAILDPILRRTAGGRALYGEDAPLPAGGRLELSELAATLERLAADGAEPFYRGDLARRTSEAVLDEGGSLTTDDLASYRVIRRTPVRARFRGHELVSNPPPSSGGTLIAFALGVLDRLGPPDEPGSARQIARLAEVMREATRARGGMFLRDLHRGGLARRLLADERIEESVARVEGRRREVVGEPAGLPSTTHVSVVDAAGNAASLSGSTGAGSGLVVPGTGIHLNNMLGEDDLLTLGVPGPCGRRLTSMMAPTLVLRDGGPRLVLGSAGSARLRGAIVQTVVNVLDHGIGIEDAVAAPRVHLNDDVLHLEAGLEPAVAEELGAMGYKTVCWRAHNIFFGGASVVARGAGGELEAAGDPRRGGAGTVVA